MDVYVRQVEIIKQLNSYTNKNKFKNHLCMSFKSNKLLHGL